MQDPTDTTSPDPQPYSGFIATDQDGEGVQPLGQSGWLTVTIAGTAYRLRNPLFKELKKLRVALQAVSDEIDADSVAVAKVTKELTEFHQGIAGKAEADVTAAERRKADKLAADARKASRDMVEKADARRMDWWTLVFDTLSVDGTPPDWPSWVVDINAPGQVMNHWRSVPLAPGR